MRGSIIGVVLAVLFVAGMFLLPRFVPHMVVQQNPAEAASSVETGFIGARRIGPWILACAKPDKKSAPMPFSLGPGKPGMSAPPPSSQPLGRCRTFLAYRAKANPKQVILMISFRLTAPAQRLAMIVRLPPIAKKGDRVTLRWGKTAAALPVTGCEKGLCVAVGRFQPGSEAALLSQKSAQLILPPGPKGKRIGVDVPIFGLPAAVAAMRRAELGS